MVMAPELIDDRAQSGNSNEKPTASNGSGTSPGCFADDWCDYKKHILEYGLALLILISLLLAIFATSYYVNYIIVQPDIDCDKTCGFMNAEWYASHVAKGATDSEKIMFKEVWCARSYWYNTRLYLGYVNFISATCSIFLSTLVAASMSMFAGNRLRTVLAWLSAFTAGFIGIMQPSEQYTRYDRAWTILHIGIVNYQQGEISIGQLWNIRMDGERIIHNSFSQDLNYKKSNMSEKTNNDEPKMNTGR